MKGLFAAAQDHGVGGFETEHGCVGRDVGARLVNDHDDAEGHAAFFDHESVGARAFPEFLADGVCQRGHLADARDHRVDPRVGEGQPVDHGAGEAGGPGGGDVLRVGGLDRRALAVDGVGHGEQDRVLPAG